MQVSSLPTTEALSGAQSRLKQKMLLTGKITGKGSERKGGDEERTGSRNATRPCLGGKG